MVRRLKEKIARFAQGLQRTGGQPAGKVGHKVNVSARDQVDTDARAIQLSLQSADRRADSGPVVVVISGHDVRRARDALENASLQLKEMLQRDGVVLSGMSVGTSAGGESGAGGQQDRNARQGSKNVTAMVDQSVRVDRVNNRQTAILWNPFQNLARDKK